MQDLEFARVLRGDPNLAVVACSTHSHRCDGHQNGQSCTICKAHVIPPLESDLRSAATSFSCGTTLRPARVWGLREFPGICQLFSPPLQVATGRGYDPDVSCPFQPVVASDPMKSWDGSAPAAWARSTALA